MSWTGRRREFDSNKGLEFKDLVETHAPRFNQLTVFDPRLPHGVRRVEGTRDPRHGKRISSPLAVLSLRALFCSTSLAPSKG